MHRDLSYKDRRCGLGAIWPRETEHTPTRCVCRSTKGSSGLGVEGGCSKSDVAGQLSRTLQALDTF